MICYCTWKLYEAKGVSDLNLLYLSIYTLLDVQSFLAYSTYPTTGPLTPANDNVMLFLQSLAAHYINAQDWVSVAGPVALIVLRSPDIAFQVGHCLIGRLADRRNPTSSSFHLQSQRPTLCPPMPSL